MEISFQISFSSCHSKSPREWGEFVAGRDDSEKKDEESVETVTKLQQAYLEARIEDQNWIRGSLVEIQLKVFLSSRLVFNSLNIKIQAQTILNLPACYETLRANAFI